MHSPEGGWYVMHARCSKCKYMALVTVLITRWQAHENELLTISYVPRACYQDNAIMDHMSTQSVQPESDGLCGFDAL